ncbi:MAG TPA: response regulator [Parasegetibacter sp.]
MPVNGRVIFLADDDIEDREIIEETLLKLDPTANIQKVTNGQQAVDYLSSCPENDLPCLIILDYKMPMLNAVEVLERINQMSRFDDVPKVVWSTSRQPEHVQQCLDNGAITYYVKPYSNSDLISMAREMLALCK